MNLKILFISFIIYSMIGWLMEVICKLIQYKRFINRGFMIGPWCPIYGIGSISLVLLLDNYKNNPVFLWLFLYARLLNIQLVLLWKNYLMPDGGIIQIKSLMLMEEYV